MFCMRLCCCVGGYIVGVVANEVGVVVFVVCLVFVVLVEFVFLLEYTLLCCISSVVFCRCCIGCVLVLLVSLL